MDDDDIDAYWERYESLSFREKLREGGFWHWLSSTNAGVITDLALSALVLAAVVVAPDWIKKHDLSDVALTVLGVVFILAIVVAMINGAVRIIRGD